MSELPHIVIIGAGLSGLCMAAKLKSEGFTDFLIFEKAGGVGGTWRDNVYPGVACDIPSHLYSFEFYQNPHWTQMFAPGAEIRGYLEALTTAFGLREHLRFGKEVVRCDYRDACWHIDTADGVRATANIVISASGFLHIPKYPDIPGIESFGGHLMHSARWDPTVDLDGRRVANIGSGSTSAQIIPAVADTVANLCVYQRTAQWVFPAPNEYYAATLREEWAATPSLTIQLRADMLAQFNTGFSAAVVGDAAQLAILREACEANLVTVADPDLRARLTPDYPVACKRLVFSTELYGALQQPNVTLVTDPITRFEPTGIRTADGTLREFDIVILSTGFDAHAYFRRIALTGENGVTLESAWADGAVSFESVALAGFPNFFMVGGPFSTVGNLSFMVCAELQASHIVKLLRARAAARTAAIVPTEAAQARFVGEMRDSARRSVWQSGCSSWYLDSQGNVSIWSKTPDDFFDMMRREIDLADYHLLA